MDDSPAAPAAAEPVPIVTVSLVTYNGMQWLPGCIQSVRDQEFAGFEVRVIDNASTDGSSEWLQRAAARDDRISVKESPTNLGFARAHNINIEASPAAFVLLLNQDVELDDGFLKAALAAFVDPAIAAVQPRILRLAADGQRTNVIDSTGLVLQRSRRVVSRRQGEVQTDEDRQPGPVWGADGPAPIYRRAALLDARVPRTAGGWEILDEDFFMYKEDVDLAWRLQLLGWDAWYAPDALAWHARSAGGPARSVMDIARTNWSIPGWIKAVSWRNQRLTQIKNDHLVDFLRDLPWIVGREALAFAFILVADPLRLRAIPRLLAALPGAMRKRSYIQAHAARRRRRDSVSAGRGRES